MHKRIVATERGHFSVVERKVTTRLIRVSLSELLRNWKQLKQVRTKYWKT